MKIRTDFVTNSSSSSFCVMVVSLKDGSEIKREFDEEVFFYPPDNAEEILKQVTSIEDLVGFVMESITDTDGEDVEKSYHEKCEEFNQSINNINSIDDVESIVIAWSEYDSDQGESPEEGSTGEQFRYNFKTKEYSEIQEPYADFVEKMIERFAEEE